MSLCNNGSFGITEAAYSLVWASADMWTVGGSVLVGVLSLLLFSYLYLWSWSFERMRDTSCPLPLPPGTMGCPLIGETLEFFRKTMVNRHLDRWCMTSASKGHVVGFQACLRLSLDFSLEVILGRSTEPDADDSLPQVALQFVNNLFSLPLAIPGFGMWKGLQARERLIQEIRRKLDASRPKRGGSDGASPPERGGNDDADFLSIVELMQQHPKLSGQQQLIEDNALQMFFAGYSSSSSTLCNVLMCMGRDPEALRKVEAELEEEGLLQDPTMEVTYDVLERLHYVHGCNSEVLRLFPPFGAVFRQANRTLQIGDFQVPKEWVLACSIRETQQTSKMFRDPDLFLPERWLQMSGEQKQKCRYDFLAFGIGNHVCSGRRLVEMFQALFLVQLVRRCRFQLLNPHPPMVYIPVPKAKDDLPIICTSRLGSCEGSGSC